MIKSRFILLTFILFAISLLKSQEQQKTILLFYITEANINGVDFSEDYINNEAYITFYMNIDDSVLTMANVLSLNKSQSYGFIKPYAKIVNDEPYESIPSLRSYYKWAYINSYDSITGSAHIELIQIFKEEKKYLILKMYTDKYEVCVYKGYSYDMFAGYITETK
ncbi:MAG: hypothetical protein Q7W45_12360 [Bacteroidota bacterium]|nr:hypothetical protein [Bacteroidota bacterium]MDP3146879.1 hypothetical protein [Bacteroidota bacterium]